MKNPYYNNIVTPVDFNDFTELIVEQSYQIATLFNCDITLLHIVHDVKSIQNGVKEYYEPDESIIRKLKLLSSIYRKRYEIDFHYQILQGDVSETIISFAYENYARLIVMGKIGRIHLNQTQTIGNNTAQVIRKAYCPVLITSPYGVKNEFNTILFPIDLTQPISQKINAAIQFSRFYLSSLKIVFVMTNKNMNRENEFKQKLEKIRIFMIENNVHCTTNLLANLEPYKSIADEILEYATYSEADMIFLMTQQEKEADWHHTYIGSTATQIIKSATVPVLTVTPFQNTFQVF